MILRSGQMKLERCAFKLLGRSYKSKTRHQNVSSTQFYSNLFLISLYLILWLDITILFFDIK
jgi:hypothetical protein